MRVAIGADHAGFPLYGPLIEDMRQLGHEVTGVNPGGVTTPEDDYPDYARMVAEKIMRGECERGIVLCGSAVGANVAANKIPGIRAGICHDIYSAHQGVEHDAMNVLCLGAKIIGSALALELVRAFLAAKYDGLPRHQRRLDKVLAIEKANIRG